MIILGIDPGTHRIGWGVINQDKENIKEVGYGCIDFKPAAGGALGNLSKIYKAMAEIIQKYRPTTVAVEKIFFFKNSKTVIEVSQARGVIVLAALDQGLEVKEFTPLQVKQAVSGYGRAEKRAVQKMVKLILGLKTEPKPDDAADALAIAICAAHTYPQLPRP